MREKTPIPQIFNPALREIRRDRAKRRAKRQGLRGTSGSFLLGRCGRDAAERINDINRRFDRAIIIGLPPFVESFQQNLQPEKQPLNVTCFDDWPEGLAKEGQPDLIISGLVLQSRNDIQELIGRAQKALMPDGLFISALLGGESLLNLRRACFAVDQNRYGGIVPRVAPMIDISQMAGLLGAAGFALPVIDRDPCRVSYQNLGTLFEDLRDIGETSHLMSYTPRYEGKNFSAQLSGQYREITGAEKFEELFDIIWATGWKPHDSQQKPLKPGSAKTRLSDALKTIRNKTQN